MITRGLLMGARLGLGVALLWAGASKLRQPLDFLNIVYGYDLVGPHIGLFVAVLLPICEIVTAVCLIGDIFVGGALLLTVLMGIMFVVAQALAIHKGLAISCGCFGSGSDGVIGLGTMIRTLALLFGAVMGFICYVVQKRDQTDTVEQESGPESAISGSSLSEADVAI